MPIHWNSPLQPYRTFAAEQHAEKEQKHAGRPYVAHLDEVVEVLMRFGAKEEVDFKLLAAAYLHDVIEDCGVSRQMLETAFGFEIAGLVWAVTNEPGKNRAERHAKTYPKVRAAPLAIRLKLADRIANVETCVKDLLSQPPIAVAPWGKDGQPLDVVKVVTRGAPKNSLFSMYAKEQPGFEMALYEIGCDEVIKAMWVHLTKLFMQGIQASGL